jgi:nitrogen fixation-related uncharacterized protein
MVRKINRKGTGSAMMFFPFFVIALIIGGGMFWGVKVFYGQGYDFRQSEADILMDEVRDCFLQTEEDFFGDNFDIYQECRFNKNVIEDGGHSILIRDLGEVEQEKFIVGVLDYQNQCFFEAAEKNRDFPKCAVSNVTKQGKEFEVLVGSAQKSKRFRL